MVNPPGTSRFCSRDVSIEGAVKDAGEFEPMTLIVGKTTGVLVCWHCAD